MEVGTDEDVGINPSSRLSANNPSSASTLQCGVACLDSNAARTTVEPVRATLCGKKGRGSLSVWLSLLHAAGVARTWRAGSQQRSGPIVSRLPGIGREAEASAYGAATSLVLLPIWVYYSAQILLARSFHRALTTSNAARQPLRTKRLPPNRRSGCGG